MISIENISKTFGGQAALLPTTLTFQTRATTVLIGPSGCGKSTLLRLIAGLISYDSGRIAIDGVGLTKAGLASGQLPINTANARVHRVREGVLLVSPGIFGDYGNAIQAPWASIQKRFQKLKLHRKTPEGYNIWSYTATGKRRSNVLKGLVIEEPDKIFSAPTELPPPNPHLSLRAD